MSLNKFLIIDETLTKQGVFFVILLQNMLYFYIAGHCWRVQVMYQELERRRNYMSFMVAMKTNNGVIIASDSYSTYPSRGLKDGNYKKISLA